MFIRSGTLTEGIRPSDFAVPPGTALRCERPAAAVAPYVTGYFAMDSDATYARPGQEWMLPMCAQIWIVLTRDPISVGIGRRRYPTLPPVLLFGPTSRAMPITASGGVSIAIELSALGWARLIGRSAETLRDQLVPLETVVCPEIVADLARTAAGADAASIKFALDAFFARTLTVAHRDEPAIVRVAALIVDPTVTDCAAACDAHGIAPRVAARIARQYFGFPLKLLMMRSRFLRALMKVLNPTGSATATKVYHDRPHFLRDARRFLGMTPRQYLAQKPVYVAAVCRARALVLGAPLPLMSAPAG